MGFNFGRTLKLKIGRWMILFRKNLYIWQLYYQWFFRVIFWLSISSFLRNNAFKFKFHTNFSYCYVRHQNRKVKYALTWSSGSTTTLQVKYWMENATLLIIQKSHFIFMYSPLTIFYLSISWALSQCIFDFPILISSLSK